MNKYIYTQDYTIRVSEINQNKKCTFPALLSLLQETSMQHIIRLKASVWDQSMQGLTWVLLRKKIGVVRYPHLGEKIRVKTFPSGFDKVFAYRDYQVLDAEENLIAKASSTWTLMDLATRRLLQIPRTFLPMDASDSEVVLPRCSQKLGLPNDFLLLKSLEISRYDLDWNNHVNNTNYLKMMLEWLPAEYQIKEPKSVEYQCKKECFLGDHLSCLWSKISCETTYHKLTKQAASDVVLAKILW